MTRDEWLTVLAGELGVDPPTTEEVDALLELAAIAAHAAERTAAPLSCWLLGRAGVSAMSGLEAARKVEAAHA